MAKALFGHVATPADPRLLAEVAGLRRRVRELEAEVARLHAERSVLDELQAVVDVQAPAYS